jgi:hypothetical protein
LPHCSNFDDDLLGFDRGVEVDKAMTTLGQMKMNYHLEGVGLRELQVTNVVIIGLVEFEMFFILNMHV